MSSNHVNHVKYEKFDVHTKMYRPDHDYDEGYLYWNRTDRSDKSIAQDTDASPEQLYALVSSPEVWDSLIDNPSSTPVVLSTLEFRAETLTGNQRERLHHRLQIVAEIYRSDYLAFCAEYSEKDERELCGYFEDDPEELIADGSDEALDAGTPR